MSVTLINQSKVDEQTIAALEELLESAKNGELTSLIYIDAHSNGDIGFGWAGTPARGMIDRMEELKFCYFAELYSGMSDE